VALLFYVRLIALTAGSLVYLFLLALILGHRRPRLFERLLFVLILLIFLVFSGGLLRINAGIQYGSPPEATIWLYTGLMVLGTIFLQPVVLHVHVQYARTVQNARIGWLLKVLTGAWYLVAVGEVLALGVASHDAHEGIGAVLVSYGNSRFLQGWALSSMLAALSQFWLTLREKDRSAKALGKRLFSASCLLLAVLIIKLVYASASPVLSDLFTSAIIIGGILPGALLIYYALNQNFLEYGAQRNLVYALSATVLALLYLGFVHRISGWLAPVFPPEATASVLLFVLIFL